MLLQVAKSDVTIKLTQAGEIRALTSVTIRAEKDGPIAYLVPEGTVVRAADVVVRFDSTQHQAALAASKVELRAAEAELRRAQQEREQQMYKQQAELDRLETDVLLAQVELADLEKKPLPEDIEKARLELEKAKTAFEHASKKRILLPELVDKGFITQTTLDDAVVGYLSAKASLQVAQFSLDKVLAGAMPEELQKARIKLAQAESAVASAKSAAGPQREALQAAIEKERANVERAKNLIAKAEAELAKTQLRAPEAGLVVYSKTGDGAERLRPGMLAFAGQNLVELPDMSTMVVDTEINEVDIRKVKIGAPVELQLDAYPGSVFRGNVLQIGTLARLRPTRPGMPASTAKVFDVTVKIAERDDRLKPGLTSTVDIIVERAKDVIAVPLSAVASQKGEAFVWVWKNGQAERRPVVLGSSNDTTVIVKEGVQVGEWIRLDQAAGSS